MKAFGDVAVRATELVQSGVCNSAREAWEMAVSEVFPQSVSLQEKSCPKSAYLGLCEAGMVKGIPTGTYTLSKDNKRYALSAARLLQRDPSMVNASPDALWNRVLQGPPKAHNSQMDVVLALWQHGFLSQNEPEA